MSVYRRTDRGGHWWYRRVVKRPDGSKIRIRGPAPVNTKAAGERAEREHIERVLDPERFAAETTSPTSPQFGEYATEFLESYARVHNKPSEAYEKERVIRFHLKPFFQGKRLHEIRLRDVEQLKAELRTTGGKQGKGRTAATVNNVLTVLSKMLKHAVDLELIDTVPRIKKLKTDRSDVEFLDFEEYAKLLDEATSAPEWVRLAILLAGDAGLRRGELRALRWGDWERTSKLVSVRRSVWDGQEGPTKGWAARHVPATKRLAAALTEARHLRSTLVLCDGDGKPFSDARWRRALPRLCGRADIKRIGWHTLRHTFCSHLAMRGAPAKTIQELAGHSDLAVTMRYMHLTPGSREAAIALLDQRGPDVAPAATAPSK